MASYVSIDLKTFKFKTSIKSTRGSFNGRNHLVKLFIICSLVVLSSTQPNAGFYDETTSLKNMNHHRSSCLSANNLNKALHLRYCLLPFICYNMSCVCPLGHAYHDKYFQTVPSHNCVSFDNFSCSYDIQCQDIDPNVVCNRKTRKCRCRRGYDRNSTGFCQKNTFKENFKMQSYLFKLFKMPLEQRNPTPSPVIDPYKTRLFIENRSCAHNSDCDDEYSYCFKGICKCWPEFHFVPSMMSSSAVVASTASAATIDSRASINNEKYNNNNNQSINSIEISSSKSMSTNYEESSHFFDSQSQSEQLSRERHGHCVRKLCENDSQCQTDDNPHLVCNKTVCECRYGYIMYRENKTCMRYMIKRQSCDLTCRIIGGLFATIFMLTLIYWCFYCCYSIVKNYRNYRSHCDMVSEDNGVVYRHNIRRRNNSGETSFSERLTASVSNFLRSQITDDPPTYLQAIEDETLPDYDTAMLEIQRLNKCSTDPHSVNSIPDSDIIQSCCLTLNGTDDYDTNALDTCSLTSDTVYAHNKHENTHKISY